MRNPVNWPGVVHRNIHIRACVGAGRSGVFSELWQVKLMTSPQLHRGLAPRDRQVFAPRQLPKLRAAAAELCWLLDRGYAAPSAVQLVGNRHQLTSRQRMAVSRCATSNDQVRGRRQREVMPSAVRGRELWLDGYNVLTVLETALSGGVVLLGRDDCCRDIAGIHRRYRKVTETLPVLRMIGTAAAAWGVTCCRWWLDKPVSNSGRLKTLILDEARAHQMEVEVELVFNPDRVLWESDEVVATSDGVVLDRCQAWVNLVRELVVHHIPDARLLALVSDGSSSSRIMR